MPLRDKRSESQGRGEGNTGTGLTSGLTSVEVDQVLRYSSFRISDNQHCSVWRCICAHYVYLGIADWRWRQKHKCKT